MAITHATATRNAIADAVAALVDVGAAGTLVILDDTTDLLEFTLSATAFGAASGGTITAASMPKSAVGLADGTADKCELRDGADTVVITGTVTATGMGGDVTLDNTSVATSQNASLTSLTYTAPT